MSDIGNLGSKEQKILGNMDPAVQQQLDQRSSSSSGRKWTWVPRKLLSFAANLISTPVLALAVGVDRLANIFGSPFMNKMFFQGGGGANRTFNVSLGIEKFLTDIGLEFGPRPGI